MARDGLCRLNECARCTCRDSAIHEQRLPRYVTAGFGREENDRGVQILRLTGTLQRNAIAKVFDPFFILVENLILLGAKPSWRKTIHGHAVLASVVGQTHRHLLYAAAAGAIRRKTRVSDNGRDRADVDDAPIAPGDHATRNGLRDKKAAAKIG